MSSFSGKWPVSSLGSTDSTAGTGHTVDSPLASREKPLSFEGERGRVMGMESGENEATQELFSHLYNDLRRLAHARLQRNEPITLLDTTSLVHETFLRVLKSGRVEVSERPRFLAYAAQVMRSIIVDFVRQRHAERRGGKDERVPLDAVVESVPSAA